MGVTREDLPIRVTFSVNHDDFSFIEPDSPLYLRVRLDVGVRLCETLVDFEGVDDVTGEVHTNLPIYLAMRLEGSRF